MSETQPSAPNSNLTAHILIAMGAGAVLGLIIKLGFSESVWVKDVLVDGFLDAIGNIFVRALQMLVVPLVLVSLICGTSSLSDPSRLGRLGGKALVLYLITTAIAITTGLILASLVGPGEGSNLPAANYVPRPAPTLEEVFVNMVPRNPISAMAEAQMIQLIVFAILFGVALTMAGQAGERIRRFFVDLNDVVMQLVTIVMKFAPLGVFALIAELVASLGIDALWLLKDYFLLVLGVLLLHVFVTYPLLVQVLTGLNPFHYIKKMRTAQLFAFSTASSNATLPVTLRTVTKRLGVHSSVASFTVPLGATINMDGTAIMQGIATVFIANAYGIDLSTTDLITVVLMATMASIGAAGVPGVGLILLATVLSQVGLPVEGIGLIIGIDRLLDMTRTAVNVTGDAAVSLIVARSEKEFDADVYVDPQAGEIAEDDGPATVSQN